VEREDLPALNASRSPDSDPLGFFGFRASNALEQRFEATGLITDEAATLAVLEESGALAGMVGWVTVQHGPSSACRAFNVGITLLPEYRGRGIGSAAQRALADYLFGSTTVERLEAGTDVDNVPEQRALEKAGFAREGVLRHAQFRDGAWRDVVLYSRLRGD
jgi:RimJ/RimL family protein N-acetyltransferase